MHKDSRHIKVSFDTIEYILIGIIITALGATLKMPQTFTLRGVLSMIVLSVMICLTAHVITEIVWRLQNR